MSLMFWVVVSIVLLVLGTAALAGLSAAPWLPTWKKDIRRMLELAQVKPGQVVYDLGAGEGRIVIMAAKEFGAKAIGLEVSVLPYIAGYIKILLKGLSSKASMKFTDLYKYNLSDADVVCAFLTPSAMQKLKPKFEQELKPGAKVVSYAFKINDWQPKQISKPTEKQTPIFLYQR